MIDRSQKPSPEHPMGVAVCGTPITNGLLVWTNEFKVGRVFEEEHRINRPHWDGFFEVYYPDGGRVLQNAERVATHFEGRKAEPEAYTYAVHFGIYPNREGWGVEVDGHWDTRVEKPFSMLGNPHLSPVVSGSWRCWGPADQATDGDSSLHVYVGTNVVSPILIEVMRGELAGEAIRNGRILDWGTVTTWQDHSETTHRWTWDPAMNITLKEGDL